MRTRAMLGCEDDASLALTATTDEVALRLLTRMTYGLTAEGRDELRLTFDRMEYRAGVGTHEQMERVRAARVSG